jgi:8-oxo-dGTP diphosphatase
MIYVTAAIIFSEDRLLIARRGPNKDLAGFWEFPGGKIEPGEDDISCLIREIKEELSLEIEISNHLINNIFEYPNKTICLKSYICKLIGGNVIPTDHDRIEWILPDQLDNYIFAPADVAIVDALKFYLKTLNPH